MNPATQKGKILGYCAEHGSITIRDAFEKLHINSPSKRISELRRSGDFMVDDITEYVLDDEGNVETKYKRYFITALEGGAS